MSHPPTKEPREVKLVKKKKEFVLDTSTDRHDDFEWEMQDYGD